MKRYVSTKIVDAEPEVRNGKDGFKVTLSNARGYWIPKASFEKAFRSVEGMTFYQAFSIMEFGGVVKRQAWPDDHALSIGYHNVTIGDETTSRKVLKKFLGYVNSGPDGTKVYLSTYLENVPTEDVLAQDWAIKVMPSWSQTPG